MTSANSATKNKRAGFKGFFGFSLKQFWTSVLLYTIILFFIIPVPILMIISDRNIDSPLEIANMTTLLANEWPVVIRYFIIPIMSIFAVAISCARFSYMKNKVAVQFYHSLPIKRSQLFLTQLAVAALALAIPYLINMSAAAIIAAANKVCSTLLIQNILTITVESAVFSLLFFSLSTIIGMVSGIGAVQLTLTAVAAFLIPVLYVVTILFIDIFNENMWIDFYLSEKLLRNLSPILRFINDPSILSVSELVLISLTAIGMLVGAWFIYKNRKSERAGIPVIYYTLGEVIKYILIYIGTLVGGLFFYMIMNDLFWTLFGMICGMVLVFMLTNTILKKTAKAMFSGWKGLLIFGGVSLILFVCMNINLFGLNDRIPSAENTKRAIVEFGSDDVYLEFTSPETIEAVHKIYSANKLQNPSHLYSDYNSYEVVHMNVVFYSRLGIPTAKSTVIYNKSAFVEEFRLLLDSSEFRKSYKKVSDQLNEGFSNVVDGYMHISYPHYDIIKYAKMAVDNGYYNGFANLTAEGKNKTGADILISHMDVYNFDYFQNPIVGSLQISAPQTNRNNSRIYVTLPIISKATEWMERYLAYNNVYSYDYETYIDSFAEIIKSITVNKTCRNDSGKVENIEKAVFTDKAQIKEILKNSANPFGTYETKYTFVDTEYSAYYEIQISSVKEPVYNDRVDIDTTDVYMRDFTINFLLGKVPEFVTNAFN